MVLVFATADISGGHLNPAVTLAFLASQKLGGDQPIVKAIVYIGCQCTGAIFGALFLKALTPESFHASHLGCNDIGNISPVQAIFIEIITTFALVITISGNAVDTEGTGNHVAPVPIGFRRRPWHPCHRQTFGRLHESGALPWPGRCRWLLARSLRVLGGTDHWWRFGWFAVDECVRRQE